MKTRSLTEGAMLGALTVLLTLLGEYLGVPALIVPVPLTLWSTARVSAGALLLRWWLLWLPAWWQDMCLPACP